jgi:hypothetical protein
MKRIFTWNVAEGYEAGEIISNLGNGILCLNDEINIKVENDYSLSVTYITDDDNESTDEEVISTSEYDVDSVEEE